MAYVRDILRHKGTVVFSVEKSATVYEAITEMTRRNAGSLLVMDGGEVCGIVTERDYLRGIAVKGKSSRSTRVQEIMSSPVVCTTPDDTIQHCLAIMTDRRCRHLPVASDDGVVGVISIGDCVKQLVRDQEAEIKHLQQYITGQYPG